VARLNLSGVKVLTLKRLMKIGAFSFSVSSIYWKDFQKTSYLNTIRSISSVG
jgi:hypothetical protein